MPVHAADLCVIFGGGGHAKVLVESLRAVIPHYLWLFSTRTLPAGVNRSWMLLFVEMIHFCLNS